MSQLTKQEKDLSIFEQYTSEQLSLIKNQIAKNSTDSELALFLSICKKRELDPFSREIYFVKYGNSKPSIIVSIDGLRSIAERTGELDGMRGPMFCGEDGKWLDVWLGSKPPSACKVTIFRKNCKRGFTTVALWSEFYNSSSPMWKRFATTMLAKCAEAGALRKAFPQVMSGLYESSEIQDLSKDDTKTTVEAEIIKEPETESNTFDIAKHKEFLTGLIQQFGVTPEVLSPSDKKEVVMSLKNVDLDFVPEIVRQFLIAKGLKDAETN